MTGESDDCVVQALDVLDDVFYVYDRDGRLVEWNRRLEEVFGLTPDELDGMAATEFFVPEDRPAIERALDDIFETGETTVEARADTVDGRVVFQLTGRLLTDADGEPVGFAGVGRDVTGEREREWQLARQNERLEEFADVLAHDLRNPLGVAQGFLDLEPTESDELDRVAAALDRIDRIVEDVLTVAREGQTVRETRPVALDAVAAAAWSTVATGDATLAVDASRTVDADETRLRRLFENLFRNAVEHGGDGVTVRVVSTPEGFAVEDDGPGLSPSARDRVFEPGFTTAAQGTGFGLNIVRNVAEAHGWTVDVAESETGGARFEFDLRRRRPDRGRVD